jgi:hypothetical protein
MVRSPAQSGRLRTLIPPGSIARVHVSTAGALIPDWCVRACRPSLRPRPLLPFVAERHQRSDQRWGATATAVVIGSWPHRPVTSSCASHASGRAASSPHCWSPAAASTGPCGRWCWRPTSSVSQPTRWTRVSMLRPVNAGNSGSLLGLTSARSCTFHHSE